MLHVIACDLPTENPETTALFLESALSFNVHTKQNEWWANNGSVSFRLSKSDEPDNTILQTSSSNFDADAQALMARDDINPISDVQSNHHTLTQLFQCDCGLKLLLLHELDEDERDELLPLPITLDWDEQVILQTQRILRVTPVAFREKARTNTTEKAEYKAVSDGILTVGEMQAMQALVEITPSFQHRALFEAMIEEGIEASRYLDESVLNNDTNT